MFLALRDLAYAKGRFALVGGVIAMITLLIVMLTGLSAGLARESVAAVSTLGSRGVDQIAFSKPPVGQKLGFDSSQVTPAETAKAARQPGVSAAATLTVAPARARVANSDVAVQAFSSTEAWAAPNGVSDGRVVVGEGLAKKANARVGQEISLGNAKLVIASISADASYQHTPVVWMTSRDAAAAQVAGRGAQSVALLKTGAGFNADQLTQATTLTAQSPTTAIGTIGSYQAENGSLTLMRIMLLATSALVVGAFFTVWTLQRTPDLAVLKAMGAKTIDLVRDAVGQAVLLLLIGGGIGTAIAAGAGWFAQRAVPFVLNINTTLVPLLLLMALGLIGSLVSVRRIATIDPNSALGALR